jgi:hypothetical protein
VGASAAEPFVEQTRIFPERARQSGLPDTSRFYWYHTVDLGDSLITTGLYDYRKTRFLRVRAAGARVVSTELPSLPDLNRFPGQSMKMRCGRSSA